MINDRVIQEMSIEEKKKFIQILPKNKVLDYIKYNKKAIPEVNGIRLDIRSEVLFNMIPNIILKRLEQGDKQTLAFVKVTLQQFIDGIYISIDEKMGTKNFVENVFKNKQEENYLKVTELLLQKVDHSMIILLLKISGIKLQTKQQRCIKDNIKRLNLMQEVEKDVYNRVDCLLKQKYENELVQVQINNAKRIKCEREKFEKVSQEILKQKQIIRDNEIKYKDQINKYNQQDQEIDRLKVKCQEIEKVIQTKDNELQISSIENIKIKEELANKELELFSIQEDSEREYQEYSRKEAERWRVENAKLVEEKDTLDIMVYCLQSDYDKLEKSIQDKYIEKQNLMQELEKYNSQIENFIDNINEHIIRKALEEKTINIKQHDELVNTNTTYGNVQPYIEHFIEVADIEVCRDIDELHDNIRNNLAEVGIKDRYDNHTDYIMGILASNKIPLIIGYKALEIAQAISSAYAGQTPEIIRLFNGFNDMNNLMDMYIKSDAKVILLEGVIGQFNENSILPLLKKHINVKENPKILLMTCEDENDIKLMPKYLLEYISLLKLDITRPRLSCNYTYSNGVKVLNEFRTQLKDIKFGYDEMKKIFRGIEFSAAYIITRAIILEYICEFRNTESALECLLISEIKLISEYYNIEDKIQINIEEDKRNATS